MPPPRVTRTKYHENLHRRHRGRIFYQPRANLRGGHPCFERACARVVPSRWEPSRMVSGGGGWGIFAPGMNMAVHRGDQARWARRNGARSVPAWGHRLNGQFAVCPTSPAHRVRDNGTAAKLAAGFGFRAITSRNGGRHHPEMVGRVHKSRAPASDDEPGLLMSRGGLGGSYAKPSVGWL
jgi:hypothetical protein